MYKQNIGKAGALQDLQDFYDYARNSNIRRKWYLQYIENLKYYRGDQWSDEFKIEFEKLGVYPFSVNRVEAIVNAYSSFQIQSNKRIVFRANTDSEDHKRIAEYLTFLATTVQTQNDHSFFTAQKFNAALLGGIGWSHFYYDDGKFYSYSVDPSEMYWDPDDATPRLDSQNFCCRSYFISVVTAKNRWSEYAQYFEDITNYAQNVNPEREIIFNNIGSDDSGIWTMGRSVRIVEVFYKKQADYYETKVVYPSDEDLLAAQQRGENIPDPNSIVRTEMLFKTFYKDIAKARSVNGEIKKVKGTRIWKGVFCNEILLEHGPYEPSIPNQQYFPYIPTVLRRDYLGIPYGVVDNLLPLATALNYIWAKTVHAFDAKYIITHDVTTNKAKEAQIIEAELKKKVGVLFSREPQNVKLYQSEATLPYLFNLLQRVDTEFELTTYLFDELKGNQTNAVSGVAIEARESQSARVSQTALSLIYLYLLVSEGKLMLDTIKGIKNLDYSFSYYNSGEVNMVSLGDEVSCLNFEVYVDTAQDFPSTAEENRSKLMELMNSNNPALAFSSPMFLQDIAGFDKNKANEYAEEFLRITGAQQPAQEASQSPNSAPVPAM